MIKTLTTEAERRKVRLMLYKDDVFVIAHKAMSEFVCSLSQEELFSTADELVRYLLDNEITDKEFIDIEIDDFEAECVDKNAVFPVLAITFIKLCALRKVAPLSADVAMALVHRCQEYEGFTELLGKISKVEDRNILNNKRTDLLNYELRTIEKNKLDTEGINQLINTILDLDVAVIKQMIFAFTLHNEKNDHKYDAQLGVLTQGYAEKMNKQNHPNTVVNTLGGAAIISSRIENPTFTSPKGIEEK